jgi:quinohemoprotein ethanol dehydrogenase
VQRRLARLGIALLAASSCLVPAAARSTGATPSSVDAHRLAAVPDDEWLSYGRGYGDQRFSPLAQVNRDTIARLGVAWWADFDTDRGQEATPLVHDGVLYTTTAWSKVYAFDARTGRRLWAFDPQVPGERGFDACCDVVNRGVALWHDKVYVGTLDGRLIALQAKTGRVAWQVTTTDPTRPFTITGAPLAVKGRIVIGNAGSDRQVRGYLSAYDAETGALAWRFYMAPSVDGAPDGAVSDAVLAKLAAKTWSPGAWQLAGGGASPWDAITYDPVTDLIYAGTGNAAPWNARFRSPGDGDNLFAASIVALRPDTGEYVWHYQTTPRDMWDFDATQQLTLADLPIGGRTRHVLMQANKNGFYYVLDAANGELLSAEKFEPASWAERIDLATGRPVEAKGMRYAEGAPSMVAPGSIGAHNWQPMAFDPRRGLAFLPAQATRGYFGDAPTYDFIPGALNNGLGRRLDRPQSLTAPGALAPSSDRFGELVAWDPATQSARWRVRFPQIWRAGVLATGGDLVFHSIGHEFVAFDARTGEPVWRYDTVAGVVAPAISYAIAGRQYVALMVGFGGAAIGGTDQLRRPGRLLVFRLDAHAKPTPYAPVTIPGKLDLTHAVASAGNVDAGRTRYQRLCISCHATGDYLPNLARSPVILAPDAFRAVVLDGALKSRGMAPFRRYFGEAELEDVRAFLLDEAKVAHPPVPGGGPAAVEHAQ